MFTDQSQNFVKVELDTSRYLGRPQIGKEFFDLLLRYDGIYLPERWDTEDRARLRHSFDPSSLREFVEEWTRAEEWKTIFFTRTRPLPIELSVDIQRHQRAKFNEFSAYIHEGHFKSPTQEKELLNFTIDMSLITRVDYGFIAHKKQERRQSPVLTPSERLPGIYWANFLGRPYIEFFGREKLLATPCYEVREINDDLILLLTAESVNASEMIESDELVNQVKEYLNQNAFAGPNFPEEKCAVPVFDFSELRPVDEQKHSPEESLRNLRDSLVAQGSELIEETDDRLVLRNTDGFVVLVDKRSNEVSVDTTGEFLLNRE
jgi:hypothetical protein